MIEDVALTKYCDLIPIGRYAAMAERGGLKDLPPQSLIETNPSVCGFSLARLSLDQEGGHGVAGPQCR